MKTVFAGPTINARNEFVQHVKNRPIICALIEHDGLKIKLVLPVGYTKGQLARFLGRLSFEYSSGDESDELSGGIWYKDGTWSERDGDEAEFLDLDDACFGWVHRRVLKIPEECLAKKEGRWN